MKSTSQGPMHGIRIHIIMMDQGLAKPDLGGYTSPRRSLSFDIIQDCRVVNSMMLILLLYTCVLFVANTSLGEYSKITRKGEPVYNYEEAYLSHCL